MRAFGAVKKMFLPDKPHIEAIKGRPKQAWEYCTKKDTAVVDPSDGQKVFAFTIGTPPTGEGARTDLHDVAAMALAGKPIGDIIAEHPTTYIKYHAGIGKVVAHRATKARRLLDSIPVVEVHVGVSGAGKSFHVERQMHEGVPIYPWSALNKGWFTGYHGETTVFFEEFKGQVPFSGLKTMLGTGPCQVMVHYGSAQLLADKFIFCSNHMPWTWYDLPHEHMQQLRRRITHIWFYSAPYDGTVHRQRMVWIDKPVTNTYNGTTVTEPGYDLAPFTGPEERE